MSRRCFWLEDSDQRRWLTDFWWLLFPIELPHLLGWGQIWSLHQITVGFSFTFLPLTRSTTLVGCGSCCYQVKIKEQRENAFPCLGLLNSKVLDTPWCILLTSFPSYPSFMYVYNLIALTNTIPHWTASESKLIWPMGWWPRKNWINILKTEYYLLIYLNSNLQVPNYHLHE